MPVKSQKLILPIFAFTLLIMMWEAGVRISDYGTEVLPEPITVFRSMMSLLFTGELWTHTVASLFRVTVGFYLAAILGIPLGMLLGGWRPAKQFLNPVIQFFRPVSPLAWIPLSMIWFGIGDKPAVFLIFLASFFPICVSTMVAVEGMKPTYFQVAANFGFTRWELVSKVMFPAILPEVVMALRISLSIAWLVVVAAEMIAVKSGLGYLIIDSRNALRMDYVLVAMIVIGAIGLVLDGFMTRVTRMKSVFWGTVKR